MAQEGAPVEKLVLKPGIVCTFLTDFGLSKNGEDFMYLTLDMSNKGVEALNKCVEEAKEVYTCLLSQNNIADPSALKELSNCVRLELQKNKIKTLAVFTTEENFVNLKYLDLSNNKFADLTNFALPALEYLDISHNKLEKVNEAWLGHAKLKYCNAADNKFKSLAPFKNCPKLEELYLQNNAVGSLTGYDGLPALRVLNLRHNKVEKIEEELVPMDALEVLNLRTNKIPDMENLLRLFQYPNLSKLNVLNCPIELAYSSMNMLVGEVLYKRPSLKRFCKIDINDALKLEAVFLAQFKWEKAEEARKAKEA